jgi:hypothetical protein
MITMPISVPSPNTSRYAARPAWIAHRGQHQQDHGRASRQTVHQPDHERAARGDSSRALHAVYSLTGPPQIEQADHDQRQRDAELERQSDARRHHPVEHDDRAADRGQSRGVAQPHIMARRAAGSTRRVRAAIAVTATT